MRLRSGKVVTSKKSKNIKTQTKLQHDITDVAHVLLELKKPYYNYSELVNEKIKSAPKDLQEDCGYCLRKVIIESFRKGINIKFEKECM